MAQVNDVFTFNYTGALQTFTVPAGVKKIKIEAYGAEGGASNTPYNGGKGGYAKGEFVVTPGEVLNIYVGGKPVGTSSGPQPTGWGEKNGGAGAYANPHFGGGGGGATTVKRGSTVLVSGGGGGGAYSNNGYGGGGGGGYLTAGATATASAGAAKGTPNGGAGCSTATPDATNNGTGYVDPSGLNPVTTGTRTGHGLVTITVLEANATPTLSVTSPSDNQVLTEGNTLSVQGSATDQDVNDPVTIYLQVNNGTPVAIHSGVSDGSTAISFAKQLEYRNKRIFYGTTDLTGTDLAENTDHTLKVWAEDNKGGKSTEATRLFRVIWNRPPTISGQDENLGTIMVPPSQTYSVTDPEGQTFTITEYLDGEVLRTFAGVAGQQYTVTIPTDKWLRTSLAQHTLKVRATDSQGLYSERTYTFTRTEDRIVFELEEPFLTDAKANRILVTLDAVIPSGATMLIEACNNAFDAAPTWEDITGPVSAGRGYIFTNTTKTAVQWGINIRFTILKGTATSPVLINGFGGAFD